ncbi:MAG TPA: helix-turn-helix transcriptional regulator [Gammaproteobacteria bacterium]|nr:helix-turn-helix transcriptional regulator [Gammaproteobacteria bacterium]
MAQVGLLVGELKRYLKAQGVTYAQLAARVGLSESSIKRLFASQTFTLQRLEEICNTVGLEIADLVELMNERREFLTELTPEQEEALLADPKLLLMTYLLINSWSLPEIVASFTIETDEAERLLIRLHRAKIIELLPFNRVKLLTARNFTWRKNGPVQRFFETQVQRDFIAGPFMGAGAEFQFVGGMLSLTGFKEMQQSIERIAREFDELARRDAVLPLTDRHACGAVFAIRPWEFSQFATLRRKK